MAEVSDWQKGGVRYAKLKDLVPDYLAPLKVEAFFVAVRGGGRVRVLNPFTPLIREYVVAATTAGIPGVGAQAAGGLSREHPTRGL